MWHPFALCDDFPKNKDFIKLLCEPVQIGQKGQARLILNRHQLLGDGAEEAGRRRDGCRRKGELKLKRSGLSLFASCKAVTFIKMVSVSLTRL